MKTNQTKYLRYASDIHLEMYGPHKNLDELKISSLWNFTRSDDPNEKYYLALSGDIGNPFHTGLKIFFDKITSKYDHIFYVAGNHEFYNVNGAKKSYLQYIEEINKICNNYENIHFLNNEIFTIDDINFIGSTLWSNVPTEHSSEISSRINDYKYIYDEDLNKITTTLTNKWNEDNIKFISRSLVSLDGPVIILTHHAPLFNNSQENIICADPIYDNKTTNFAFHNNLLNIIDDSTSIIAWIFGHTHYTNKFKYNDITFATNQFGYSHEITNYSAYAMIELNTLIMESI